jgi:hypothetical protein
MPSRTGYGRIVLLMLAAGVSLASVPVNAQTVPATESESSDQSESPDTPPELPAMEADAAATADDSDIRDLELDWSQLNVDASTLTTSPASKARVTPKAGIAENMTWSSLDKPNGSSALSVKQPLSPFWDTRVGADMTVVRQPTTMSELLAEKVTNGGSEPQSSGSAWAAVTAPGVNAIWDKTAVEARVDPSQEQSKLGTSLSKSVSLNEQYSVTLQNDYNLIQQGHSSLPCADCVNLSAVPVPGIISHPSRNYETEQSAKLDFPDTGTSFSAGQTLSSADDRWLRKVGAEQKLFGGVSISGSIGETALGTVNKTLSAGFKQSW